MGLIPPFQVSIVHSFVTYDHLRWLPLSIFRLSKTPRFGTMSPKSLLPLGSVRKPPKALINPILLCFAEMRLELILELWIHAKLLDGFVF